VSLTNVVEDCHHRLRCAKNRGVTIMRCSTGAAATLADERALRQSVLNFLSKRSSLPVRRRSLAQGRLDRFGRPYMSIQDTGPGIPGGNPIVAVEIRQGSNAIKVGASKARLGPSDSP